MNDFYKKLTRSNPLKYYMVIVMFGWTLVIVVSLLWNVHQEKQSILEMARTQARTAYEKDLVYRAWNADLGGVYVPVTNETLPNPYLDIPGRDIETTSGRQLTLMNPAYMTRRVHELGLRQYGLRGHITSLRPIRPENAADAWETEALKSFERGEAEVSSIAKIEGESYMRLMRPLVTEKGCVKCHASQGFKAGDIRGGISVAVPMAPLLAISQKHLLTLWGGHSVFLLLGIVGIVLGVRRLEQSVRKKNQADEKITLMEESLAERNEELQEEIYAQKMLEEKLQKQAHALGERVKELDCLYAISKIVEDTNASLEKIFQGTVDIIPPAWQYPEITSARITLKDKTYKTNNFKESVWKQFSDIIVYDDRIGALEVYYQEERPEIDGGPFLKEERNLINVIAERLGKIIERKQVADKLKETKNHLDNVIESSLDGIVIGDSAGTILSANNSFLQLLGYEREEVIGRHTMELSITDEGTYESTTGERIEITEEFFNNGREMIEKLYEEGKISNWESYYFREDGKIVPVEMSVVFLYDKEGTIIGVVGINRDITDRKKVDLEKSRLLEETKSTLEELKKTQSYLLQSEKMASVGQLAAGVAHEINNPTGFIHSNLGSLNKYSNKVLELLKRYEEGLASLKNNGSKEVASFYEEMDELKKKLKIDFVMKDFQKVIADSLNGTGRIKKIVGDLKSFSRVDQEEFKQADINEGLKSTLNMVWNELKYKCTVEKEYGDLPQIYCNLGQLNQVFVNLLINAAQAIEEKGVITISTRYLNGQSADNNKEQDYIEIKISDTGRGIPEDKLSRIFEPFFTTKDVGKGTGLGLSIAYDIIQKHQGEISVQSEAGNGTTFTIKLPLTENRDEKLKI